MQAMLLFHVTVVLLVAHNCNISTIQESSITSGMFKLDTVWSDLYKAMIPSYFDTELVDWDANLFNLKVTLESVVDMGVMQ